VCSGSLFCDLCSLFTHDSVFYPRARAIQHTDKHTQAHTSTQTRNNATMTLHPAQRNHHGVLSLLSLSLLLLLLSRSDCFSPTRWLGRHTQHTPHTRAPYPSHTHTHKRGLMCTRMSAVGAAEEKAALLRLCPSLQLLKAAPAANVPSTAGTGTAAASAATAAAGTGAAGTLAESIHTTYYILHSTY
jgi:hypothetical protein